MSDLNENDKLQYQILNDRIWHYNDLLWKNFLAYGGALAALAGYLKGPADFSALAAAVGVLAALILLGLGVIQCALISGLGRTVVETHALEKRNVLPIITKRPEEIKNNCGLSVQKAYWSVATGMILISLGLLVAFLCQLWTLKRCA